MNRIWGVYIVVAILIGVVGCKSKKSAVVPVPERVVVAPKPERAPYENLMRQVTANANTFSFYHASGKAEYKDPDQNYDFDVSIVMEKNKYIQFTVTALLGIEAFRVLVTPDSISILDRLHRTHTVTGFHYIEKMSNIKMALPELQNLIIGNYIFPHNDQHIKVDSALQYTIISSIFAPMMAQVTYLQQANLKVSRNTLIDKNTNRELKIEYASYHREGMNMYPSDININIRAEKNMECRFTLSYFAFEKKKDLQFVVPKNYKTVRI